jgi:uncharacterized protein YdhG (YjbR/CyaY superfamily)
VETFLSVDQYLESVESESARSALSRIRSIVLDELPEATESISYGIPMVKYYGMVVGFAAFKNHCSLFPGHAVADFTDELKDYKTSKGTIQFSPIKPLPEALIRAIVRKRADENFTMAVSKGKVKASR